VIWSAIASWRFLLGISLALALPTLGACDGRLPLPGDSSGEPPDAAAVAELGSSSGVWEWQRVDLLDPGSRRELCDWANGRGGGYGRQVVCATGVVANDADRAACDRRLFVLGACGVVTHDVEACSNASAADLCAAMTSPFCAPLLRCR
jgi:hypothetical protein